MWTLVTIMMINKFCGPKQGLEQGRHELRLKLEGCQSQWESQVSELERDVRELRSEVERLTKALAESERDRSQDREEHSEHSQRLGEMLTKVGPSHRCRPPELRTSSGPEVKLQFTFYCLSPSGAAKSCMLGLSFFCDT